MSRLIKFLRLNYFILTLKHKYFVFKAGLKTKVPIWRLLVHDWSKFTLAEYPHYQRRFFDGNPDPEGFKKAWLHHQNYNPHHWEYWITRSSHRIGVAGPATVEVLPMPETYVLEMVADWMGAGMAYTGKDDVTEWLKNNFQKMSLHDETVKILTCVLDEQGYKL